MKLHNRDEVIVKDTGESAYLISDPVKVKWTELSYNNPSSKWLVILELIGSESGYLRLTHLDVK